MARKKHGRQQQKQAAESKQIEDREAADRLEAEATRIIENAGGLPGGEPASVDPAADAARPREEDVAEVRRIENVTIKLSTEERSAIGVKLCDALTKRDEVEEEKKAIAKQYSDKIGGLDAEIVALKKAFMEGIETREVEVVDVTDYTAKKVRTLRADNREQIAERDLRPHELQLELRATVDKMKAAGASDDEIAIATTEIQAVAARQAVAADLTEEQTIASTPEEAEQIRAARLAKEADDREDAPRIAQSPPRAYLKAPPGRRGQVEHPSVKRDPFPIVEAERPIHEVDPFDPDREPTTTEGV